MPCGAGVDETTKTMMRTAGSDPYVQQAGVALRVAGRAVHGDERFRFEWSLRRSLEYSDCGGVEFESGSSGEVELYEAPNLAHGSGTQ